ncbi:MAG: class I SAM-dependent methyltransferase [Thermoplasmata archaeon]
MSSDFERQVTEGTAIPVSGWDFSPIEERWRRGNPPWNYAEILREKMRTAASMVDLGTGGGEFLASLAPLPRKSFATEGYPPNLAIAQRRLGPLGVRVLPIGPDLRIDLPDATVDLVADRHEDFSGSEVRRILTPGGWFVTQQVGGRNNVELSQKFAARPPRPTNQISSSVELAEEIAGAGLAIDCTKEATYADEFLDIGALVFYLRMIPWEVPGFSLDRHREPLREIYEEIERVGSFRVTTHRLLVVAQRPG